MAFVDFFIVGAPKSGTTALYSYLQEHSDVFLPFHKEPNYFADDYRNIGGRINNFSDYQALYTINNPHKLAGDASVCYLSSSTAAQKIHNFNANAKIIIMLRKPLDLFLSEHSQLIYSFYESETNPYKAWELQGNRAAGKNIPSSCREREVLQYHKTCSLGSHVEKYLTLFPRENICIILFEDFIRDSASSYRKVLQFLNLRDDQRREFPPVNEAKQHQRSWLARLLIAPPGRLGKVHAWLRKMVATSNSRWIQSLETAVRKLLKSISKKQSPGKALISETERQKIQHDLLPEIEKLEKLLAIDLSHWKQ